MISDHLRPPVGVRQMGPQITGTRLVLVRHGECVANAEGIAGGMLGDGGLTELGVAQARALATRVANSGEFDAATALYTSAMPRARETGSILRGVFARSVTPVVRADLNEIDVGEADGLTWDAYVERYDVPDWSLEPHRPMAPGGESLIDFHHRSVAALEDVATSHEGELVVVVTHGGVIEQALKRTFQLDASTRLGPRIQNCSLSEFEVRDGTWHLLRFNDLSPLPRG